VAANFYVAPEQLMKDRAEYARKGIARGRALVAVAFAHGVVFVGENPSASLHKTSEIYDRIAFAAVGRYNEFEALRVAGIRLADVKGYQYAREDVTAKPLANAYSQALGASFMGDSKPFEVELLIAQVDGEVEGDSAGSGCDLELFHILYDGSIVDEHRYVVIGGDTEPIRARLEERYAEGLARDDAIRAAVGALSDAAGRPLSADILEVSGLDARRPRRRFFRVPMEELAGMLET
jgi:proteasome alpha subunit